MLVSAAAVLVFLLAAYSQLTNVQLRLEDVLPGALLATGLLELTFQALPIYLRLTRTTRSRCRPSAACRCS